MNILNKVNEIIAAAEKEQSADVHGALCNRCNTYRRITMIFEGRHYGTECIQKVYGKAINVAGVYISFNLMAQIMRETGQSLDIQAYVAQVLAEREIQTERKQQAAFNYADAEKARQEQNKIDNEFLFPMLEASTSPFAASILAQLKSGERNVSDLSVKVIDILANMYSRFHGKNDKQMAYYIAAQEFAARLQALSYRHYDDLNFTVYMDPANNYFTRQALLEIKSLYEAGQPIKISSVLNEVSAYLTTFPGVTEKRRVVTIDTVENTEALLQEHEDMTAQVWVRK